MGDGPLHDGAVGGATVAARCRLGSTSTRRSIVGIVAVSGVVSGVLRAIKHVITPGADYDAASPPAVVVASGTPAPSIATVLLPMPNTALETR